MPLWIFSIFNFLKGISLKDWLYIAGFCVVAYLSWDYIHMKKEITANQITIETLQKNASQQQQVIESIQKSAALSNELRDDLIKSIQTSQDEINKLKNKLDSLQQKIKTNPTEAQTEINIDTKEINRCLEIATGSKVNAEDKNNPNCPNLTGN